LLGLHGGDLRAHQVLGNSKDGTMYQDLQFQRPIAFFRITASLSHLPFPYSPVNAIRITDRQLLINLIVRQFSMYLNLNPIPNHNRLGLRLGSQNQKDSETRKEV
jgi:hypothetical protein